MDKKKKNSATNGHPPLRMRLIRGAIGIAGLLTPPLAARWIYNLWFKTYRHNPPPRELAWAKDAQRHTVDSPVGRLSAVTWGPRPGARRVLLVHGWNGRATQMGAFADPLAQQGFEVWALDLPGHGESSGSSSNLILGAQAVRAAHQAWGPFHAVVGHSFGAASNLLALHQGLPVQRAVSISQPPNVRWLLEFYCRLIGATPKVENHVMQLIEKNFGEDIWRLIDSRELLKSVDTMALVVHDKNDREVPFEHGQAIADAWRGSRLLATQGLGHHRILRAPEVVAAAVEFIAK